MTYLRQIALVVEEQAPGSFGWILIESVGTEPGHEVALATSDAPFPEYMLALGDACGKLELLCAGDAAGPRSEVQAAGWS
jgi:hypothetical protein